MDALTNPTLPFFILLRLTILVIIFCTIFLNPTCKDTKDLKPPEDTLLPPPAPPKLLSPSDSFVRMPTEATGRLLLTWEAIKDAKIYEIYFDGDTTDEWTVSTDTNFFSLRLQGEPWEYMLDKFIWKVRANSSKWQYYTDWSEPRHFEIRLRPEPPHFIYPPNDTNLFFDTLPAELTLEWTVVQDEQFYDVKLLIDTFPYYVTTVQNNSCIIILDTTGTYYWQVRAGSKYWEYYTEWSALWRFSVTTSVQ